MSDYLTEAELDVALDCPLDSRPYAEALVAEVRASRALAKRVTAMCDRTMDGSHVTDARSAGAYDFARAVIEEMEKR